MTKTTEKQTWIIEEDAMCITDVDPVAYPSHLRVQYNGQWFHINPDDFWGWMYETGRIDHYERGTIRVNQYTYSPDELWHSETLSGALDIALIEYRKSGASMTAEEADWLSDIRQPQPAGPEVPGATWQEHAEAEAAELPPFSTRGWAEFVNHTENR